MEVGAGSLSTQPELTSKPRIVGLGDEGHAELVGSFATGVVDDLGLGSIVDDLILGFEIVTDLRVVRGNAFEV